tara:strand:+ start:142 stop:492 length:351 start_codon:yes stop_codon:yes gene_type:complete
MKEDCKCKTCQCGKKGWDAIEEQMDDQTKPFTQQETPEHLIRTFDPNAPDHLFKWHRDGEDRKITPIENVTGWLFQFDNELPQILETGKSLVVEKGEWHRLIKGIDNLVLKIEFPS